ncbi:hypothetical protein BJ508DRAFT_85141 [Ascobolus immersus RN42]|uniref:Uncharacterized protein n=1 Tax=Ascobolus immersus RN42 TaxID=1160509 RepID=A0A3N4HHP8_ASCIM|nr:hypothetical protein BJ508DRAFT_85141 [Ascobolus immersus RN42]
MAKSLGWLLFRCVYFYSGQGLLGSRSRYKLSTFPLFLFSYYTCFAIFPGFHLFSFWFKIPYSIARTFFFCWFISVFLRFWMGWGGMGGEGSTFVSW